ncbi:MULTISPECIES: hypothetical protein [Haloferax]|jgi:hypothetical protein|uniref:Uncharacterized protein n=2 Tax=Haloferax volcanii TaxID=2246 RepID=M0I664_HALVO
MSRLSFLLPGEDDTIGRFLTLTLVIYAVISGFEILGVLWAMCLAMAVWTLATAIQGFRYGYLEGAT